MLRDLCIVLQASVSSECVVLVKVCLFLVLSVRIAKAILMIAT